MALFHAVIQGLRLTEILPSLRGGFQAHSGHQHTAHIQGKREWKQLFSTQFPEQTKPWGSKAHITCDELTSFLCI